MTNNDDTKTTNRLGTKSINELMVFFCHTVDSSQWAKSPKNQYVGVYFYNMALLLIAEFNKKRTSSD